MSYDNPDTVTYFWTDATFGATTVNHFITGPKGKVGFVRDIEVDVATALVGTTTVPEIDVGIATGDTTYGRYRLGTAVGAGYPVGSHKASNEPAIVGNPPRTANDFAGHVVLDGGPLFSTGIAGGSFGTVAAQGRIPASGRVINNVVSGTGGVVRLFMRDPVDPQIVVGQTVNVSGVQGATLGGNSFAYQATISALSSNAVNPANPNWIELTGVTFGGTYTGGGLLDIVTWVTNKAGVGGTPAGGGTVRLKIEWVGQNNV